MENSKRNARGGLQNKMVHDQLRSQLWVWHLHCLHPSLPLPHKPSPSTIAITTNLQPVCHCKLKPQPQPKPRSYILPTQAIPSNHQPINHPNPRLKKPELQPRHHSSHRQNPTEPHRPPLPTPPAHLFTQIHIPSGIPISRTSPHPNPP